LFVCVFCFRCSLPHSGALCPLSGSVLCSGLLSPLAFLGLVAHIREEEERSADPEVAANEPRAVGGHKREWTGCGGQSSLPVGRSEGNAGRNK
jgi:hypothetical protein